MKKTAWKSDDAGVERSKDSLQVAARALSRVPAQAYLRVCLFDYIYLRVKFTAECPATASAHSLSGIHRRQARRIPAVQPRLQPVCEHAG